MQANAAPLEEGVYRQKASLPPRRFLPEADGTLSEIVSLAWTETVHASPITTVVEAEGEPVRVLQQLDDSGGIASGRLVVDRSLYAWTVEPGGRVVPRGTLIEAYDDESGAERQIRRTG